MLFIPIDVFNKKFSLLKHLALIMLHDYLHCLVFKEQSVLSLSALASSDSFILSHSAQLVKNFFEVFFEAFRPFTAACQSRLAGLFRCRIRQRLVLYYTSRRGLSTPFLKKSKKSQQIAVCRGVQFVVKVSCSYVVRGERGVLFLFPAKRPPRKIALSSCSRRAGQRRCFQRICLAAFYRGPAFTSFRQSLPTEKSLLVRPKPQTILLPRTRYSRNKNIDVLAPCHRENAVLYGHRLGRRW